MCVVTLRLDNTRFGRGEHGAESEWSTVRVRVFIVAGLSGTSESVTCYRKLRVAMDFIMCVCVRKTVVKHRFTHNPNPYVQQYELVGTKY